jgi:hypothetical protein
MTTCFGTQAALSPVAIPITFGMAAVALAAMKRKHRGTGSAGAAAAATNTAAGCVKQESKL